MMRSVGGCVVLVSLAAACSGGSGSLDCALLRGDNCWKTALGKVRACGGQTADGGTTASGTLGADGLTCSYPDGRKVLFDKPVSFPLDPKAELGFTVEQGGKPCFSFHHVGSRYDVTVGGETVRFEGILPDEAVLTCPDGSVHRGSYKALLACESNYDKRSEFLPSEVWQGSGTSFAGLELNGAGPGSPVTLFMCDMP